VHFLHPGYFEVQVLDLVGQVFLLGLQVVFEIGQFEFAFLEGAGQLVAVVGGAHQVLVLLVVVPD
jgi:hypothetical protein